MAGSHVSYYIIIVFASYHQNLPPVIHRASPQERTTGQLREARSAVRDIAKGYNKLQH